MNLTIDLPEQVAAVLESRARAAHMSIERYAAHIVSVNAFTSALGKSDPVLLV